MQKSIDPSAPVMARLKSWLSTHTDVRNELNEPKEYGANSKSERINAQIIDRSAKASAIVDKYIDGKDVDIQFTGMMNELCSLGNAGSRKTYRSAVREVLHEFQEQAWAEYIHPSNSHKRKLAVVR